MTDEWRNKRSIYSGECVLMYRTILQLFGVFGVFIRSIGPHSTYRCDFEQK
ncbi:hypothetical protein MKX34_14120 [Paenibacillus sp. FSL R5-0636]|uniref:hypothetical protein n=1 Tax=Paenibacillus sp. FSL R5-0636 TaxID=2921652 RepID=UPI0030D31493